MTFTPLSAHGFLTLIFITSTAVAGPWWQGDDTCPIESDTNIVFYGETGWGGVGDLSRAWLIHFLDWWQQHDPSLRYKELDSDDVREDCNLADYPELVLYIQPGGNAYYQQRSLDAEGRASINAFIDGGKAFLGICAGFYYTATDYFWQDKYYDWPELLSRFPTVEGSITDIADYNTQPGYALTGVSSGHQMIYYGGPTRGWRDTPLTFPGAALLTFSDIPGDLPAAIQDGNTLLMSVHAEAYEDEGISGLTTEQRIENYIWLAQAINDVAGTGFLVPEPPVAECSDGDDNDADGLIDWPADPGCDSADDDSELETLDVFFDGFEDGALDGWSLYGAGTPWQTTTLTAYEGAWSAMAKMTGAGDPSYLEAPINAQGYETLTLSYYRKLVGLDTADDFEVAYYAAGQWVSLEHLSDGRASDAAFVPKSYALPTSAEKIRFLCECGAISEQCYVDNVRITAP